MTRKRKLCRWTFDREDIAPIEYETDCGNTFRVDAGLEPYEFCPFCGGEVSVEASEEK